MKYILLAFLLSLFGQLRLPAATDSLHKKYISVSFGCNVAFADAIILGDSEHVYPTKARDHGRLWTSQPGHGMLEFSPSVSVDFNFLIRKRIVWGVGILLDRYIVQTGKRNITPEGNPQPFIFPYSSNDLSYGDTISLYEKHYFANGFMYLTFGIHGGEKLRHELQARIMAGQNRYCVSWRYYEDGYFHKTFKRLNDLIFGYGLQYRLSIPVRNGFCISLTSEAHGINRVGGNVFELSSLKSQFLIQLKNYFSVSQMVGMHIPVIRPQ